MGFKENIKARRIALGMTTDDVAKLVGVSNATISRWETGAIANQRRDKIQLLADALRTTPAELMGWEKPLDGAAPDNIVPLPQMKSVPLVGTIACGEPILAVENVEGSVSVPENVHADFALRCKGDSMIGARINDGDLVFIRQQPTVDDGQIAAVQIGDDATLKRVYHSGKTLVLQAENPAYKPIIVDGDSTVRVLGLAVAFISPIR